MSLLRILHDEMRPLFYSEIGSDPWQTVRLPRANIQETDDSFVIHLLAPGLSRSDFQVTVGSGYVSVRVETEEEQPTDQFVSREYSYNSFERCWKIPSSGNEEAISAKYQAGVLQVHIPKGEKQSHKKLIQVE